MNCSCQESPSSWTSLTESPVVLSDQLNRNFDIAVRRLGVWTDLVRFSDQAPGDAGLDAWYGDTEARTEKILATREMQINLGINRNFGRQIDLLSSGREREGAFETRRPAGGEQLLRIGSDAGRAGGRQLDIQMSVRAARSAAFPPASGVRPGSVDDFSDLRHRATLSRCIEVDDPIQAGQSPRRLPEAIGSAPRFSSATVGCDVRAWLRLIRLLTFGSSLTKLLLTSFLGKEWRIPVLLLIGLLRQVCLLTKLLLASVLGKEWRVPVLLLVSALRAVAPGRNSQGTSRTG